MSRPRLSAIDPASGLLSLAVWALPEHRREWGTAMLAELTEVRGRSARWRFAVSSARATLLLPPAGGWPMLALVAGAAAVVTTAVGPVVTPALKVFAMTFAGLVGAMAVLAVARSRRPRLSVPTLVVVAAVAASIASTAYLLHRAPTAALHLPPAAAVFLALGLACCLWVASTPQRGGRLEVAAAVLFAGWFVLSNRLDGTSPPVPVVVLLAAVVVATPLATFFLPAFLAGRDSLRAGLRAATWTVAAAIPLTYAVWLPEALRRHGIDGHTLDGELLAPVGANLSDALAFCLAIFPLIGLALGATGAAAGARSRPAPTRTDERIDLH